LSSLIVRRPIATLLVVTFLVIWGLITHGTSAGAGDEPHYLMIARSLAFDGDADLANDYADERSLIAAGKLDPDLHARPGRGGVLRSVHDIGLPLLAVPALWVVYPTAERLGEAIPASWLARFRLNPSLLLRHQISLLMAIVAGCVAVELWRLLKATGASPTHAFWWALLGVLSPPLLSHAFLFFTEVPSALLVLISLRRLLSPPGSMGGALLTGLTLGFLGLVHVRNAPIALGLALVALGRHEAIGWRRLGAMAGGLGLVVLVRTAIHQHFWGSPFLDRHARVGGLDALDVMGREAMVRATGMLFDQEFGLLIYGPIYVLAPAGMALLWRRLPQIGRPLCLVWATYVTALIVSIVNPYGWVGGFSPAARFLVPIAPLMLVGASMCARSVRGVARAFVTALIALQLTLDAAVWQMPRLLWNDGDGVSAFRSRLPDAMSGLWTLFPTWHAPDSRTEPFWIASAILLTLTVWLLTAPGRLERAHHRSRAGAPSYPVAGG
jgi:hypothetical protein